MDTTPQVPAAPERPGRAAPTPRGAGCEVVCPRPPAPRTLRGPVGVVEILHVRFPETLGDGPYPTVAGTQPRVSILHARERRGPVYTGGLGGGLPVPTTRGRTGTGTPVSVGRGRVTTRLSTRERDRLLVSSTLVERVRGVRRDGPLRTDPNHRETCNRDPPPAFGTCRRKDDSPAKEVWL